MRKKAIKILLVFAFILLIIVGLVYFIGGGFGMKRPVVPEMVAGRTQALFAHRGVVVEFPENSREAILRAKQLGFTCLEVDLRKTADGEFVLFHDGDCRRLLGIEAELTALSTAEVKRHKLLANGTVTACEVLTLKEMLDEFGHDFLFYFDLKLKNTRDAEDLAQVIEQYGITENSIVASASPAVIMCIEFRHPEILTALEGLNAGKEWLYMLIPKNLKPDYLSGFASKVDKAHVDWLRRHDLLPNRIVYGVDSSNYQEVTSLGIRNMIIDYFPGLDSAFQDPGP